MMRHGRPHTLVTDKLRSDGAAMKVVGNANRQETGRWENNRAMNAHPLPDSGLLAKHEKGLFRRRERAMQRFRSMGCLQKFAAVHASVYNHFNQERALHTRQLQGQPNRCSGRVAPTLFSMSSGIRRRTETSSHPSDSTNSTLPTHWGAMPR